MAKRIDGDSIVIIAFLVAACIISVTAYYFNSKKTQVITEKAVILEIKDNGEARLKRMDGSITVTFIQNGYRVNDTIRIEKE